MTHQLICIQSDDVGKAILIASFDETAGLKTKKQTSRSRNVTVKKLRTKAQKRKENPLERGSALYAFAQEIFTMI